MGDTNDCALRASSRPKAVVAGLELTVLSVCGCPSAFDQRRGKMRIAFSRVRTELLSSTLIVAGAHARPGCELSLIVERRHVGADFRLILRPKRCRQYPGSSATVETASD